VSDAGSDGATNRAPAHGAAFWVLAALLGMFLFAASAPSPLYSIYARRWGFSPTTVTTVYAVYAAGALAALLVTGRLSDHIGRRPVVALALGIQIAGMIAFIVADGLGALLLGRILQGIGTGIASGAISAWLIDLEPPEKPRLGSLVTGIALLGGLGAGAFFSALLVEYQPQPLRLVFWLLTTVYVAAAIAIVAVPDVVTRSAGALGSLRPRIGIPPVARGPFVDSTPSLVAMWALAGLYLSLGPSLAATLANSDNRVVGGLVIFGLMGAGAVASGLVQSVDPRTLIVGSCVVVVVGVAVTLFAVVYGSTAVLYVGTVVAGLGVGPGFSGVVRSLGPLAPPEKRGALFAALYIVVYVSISIPTIAAGLATSRIGLRQTTYVYGAAVIALTAATFVAVTNRSRRLARNG
jgi:MFS family permease